MREAVRDLVRWYALAVRMLVKDLWDGLPGPWWVKVLLIAVTQAIPGPQDEIVLVLIVAAVRKYKARKLAMEAG